MPIGRFWGSVWSVVKYLVGLGLLAMVLQYVVTLFGLMPAVAAALVVGPAVALACVAGTFLYADWQWGWKASNMGLPFNVGALSRGLAGGIAAGAAGALLAQAIGGQGPVLNLAVVGPPKLLELGMILLASFVVELIFRGAVVSRYQYDLSHWEVLAAATLTPFGWVIVNSLLRFGAPSAGVNSMWQAAMSVALTLLFLRFDSVWLTTGIRFGMVGTMALLGLGGAGLENGALIVWGSVAAALLALEWFKRQGQPKRMQPTRGRVTRGRMHRGPWGPH